MFKLLVFQLLLFVHIVCSARLSVSIEPNQLLANPSTLPSSTHAVLLGSPGTRYDVPLRKDNTFVFPELVDGSYLLTIHCRDYLFHPFRVDVTPAAAGDAQQPIAVWQTFRGNEWSNKGPAQGSGQGALEVQVRASALKEYYQQRGGFSLISFVKSPMILMALVSGVMIFGLPYMMENMDPEMKKEFEDMQRKQPLTGESGAATQLQNFDLAGWMAGKSSGSNTPTSGGGGAKRR